MTVWVPKPVEFEWFVSELTIGRGIWVEAYIDTQFRGLELDGWQVESWLHPTQTHHRRLVVHACRRIALTEAGRALVDELAGQVQ
jgi:hypothetical protein